MQIKRKKTRKIKIKDIYIGGDSPIIVQSMTNLPLDKVKETIDQINKMQSKGAGLVRVAVQSRDEVKFLKVILGEVKLPICADIHFDYKIALESIDAGVNKIRINPGNIGSDERVRKVAKAAKSAGVPIRIGVNGGSIDKKKYSHLTARALVDSALSHIQLLENNNFEDIVVSLKSSDIRQTIEANILFNQIRDYPIHIGLTEAGYGQVCIVQSSIVIGNLLFDGIGDTVRVSMTGDPIEEIDVAYNILRATGNIKWGIKIISCPTCGRTSTGIDLLEITKKLEIYLRERFNEILEKKRISIKIAVMGCEVNGPGEASHADAGIAGARNGTFLFFKAGKPEKTIKAFEIQKTFENFIKKYINN